MAERYLREQIDEWFERDYRETFMERIERLLESETLFAGEEGAIQYGHTLEHILSGISVVLRENERIAGAVKMRIPTKEEEEHITAVYRKWWDMPTKERHKKILFYYSEGWLKCRPYWFPSFGHLAMDWETILDKGLAWMCRKAERGLDEICNEDQKTFLTGTILCYEALERFIGRYATEAGRMGRTELAANLSQIKEGPAKTFVQALQLLWLLTLVLQKVCGCGVLNFSRMDQYLYPYYRRDVEEGRLDREEALRLLEEFFFKNNEIMVQTDHMSQEIQTTAYTLEVAYDDPNYLILGGKRADGSTGVNELSYLMVEAAHDLGLRNPFLVVRYHEGIPKDFWKYSVKAMRDNTTLVLYNDETMIPALKYFKVEEPEVYDYGFFGCNDPNIPAYEGGLRQVWINLARPLELALNQGDYPLEPRGTAHRDERSGVVDSKEETQGTDDKPGRYEADSRDEAHGFDDRWDRDETDREKECQFDIDDRMTGLMTGAYYGTETKPLEEIHTMEAFLEEYEKQVTYLMGEFRKGFEMDFCVEQKCTRNKMRIEDCFLKGTIENKVTWTEGGTKYHKIVTQGCGVATVINSLYAIDEIVFRKKEMTLPELAGILRNDYKGQEFLAERYKRKLAKFGNDIDEVDRYAKIVTDIFIRAVEAFNGSEYLYQMWPTYSTDRDFTTMGYDVGATPDGRRAREPLSENQSPAEGTDISGLTAMLNSVARIPFEYITGGPLNVRIHPSAVAGEEGLEAMCALFETYMENGGMQLQVNVVDAETLKRAQKEPEKYKTLCVRVTGYSAFFVEMGKKAQEELIRRTEQAV